MIYKKWDIVLVPFSFTNLRKTKKRPGLIISHKELNKYGDVVIAFITSNLKVPPKFGDYEIKQWEKAGLPKPSLIRIKLTTISSNIIIKKIGKLDKTDAEEFKKKSIEFINF